MLFALIVVLISLLVFINWRKHSYWSEKGVPTPPYLAIIGHHLDLFRGKRWLNVQKWYSEYADKDYWGLYEGLSPVLYIRNPQLAKDILVKRADSFQDRRTMKFSGADKCFNEMLSVMKGPKWSSLRFVLESAFSNVNPTKVFEGFTNISERLVQECKREMTISNVVDMKCMSHYYVMDAMLSAMLNVNGECFANQESCQFIQSVSYMTSFSFEKFIKFIFLMISPKLFNAFGFQFTTKKNQIFIDAIEKVVSEREAKGGTNQNDILELLIKAKNDRKNGYPVTHNTVIAETVLFLIAGFETTASTLSFALYLLAKHPEEQEKVRQELQELLGKNGEKISHENIMEASYLKGCVNETLRLFPPNHYTERICTRKYRIPGTSLDIQEGTLVGIPIWSFHHDKNYWTDPESFLPERFLPENKDNIDPAVYLPFGLGPRNCIGSKFAELSVITALANLIQEFELKLADGFKEISLDKTVGSLRPDSNGVRLVLVKRI